MPYRAANGRFTRNRYAGFAGAAYRTVRRYGKGAAGAAAAAIAGKVVNRIAQKATQQASRSFTQIVRRRGKKVPKRVYKSAQTGAYAGKFSRRPRGNPFTKFVKAGVVLSEELGTVVTGSGASLTTRTSPSAPVYIGHSTHGCTRLIQKAFWMAVVRMCYQKAGMDFKDFLESPGAATLNIGYSYNDSGSLITNVAIVTTGKTYEAIAVELLVAWKAQWDTLAGQKNMQLYYVNLTYGGSPNTIQLAYIDLRSCTIEVMVKSDLKLQNRTTAPGTDEDANSTENVANQPLYGKSYEGKGSGMLVKTANVNTTAFNTSQRYGFFSFTLPAYLGTGPQPAIYKALGEIPLPELFTPKPKLSTASLEPGKIKTSSLMHTVRLKQVDFWNTLLIDFTPENNSEKMQARYGKFKIFALEKNLCVSYQDSLPVIGVELNNRFGLKITGAKSQTVAEYVNGQEFITHPF